MKNCDRNTIVVDLDSTQIAPLTDETLSELLQNFNWAEDATCATQEIDGEILFWSCEIHTVENARATADLRSGLMPLLGIGNQVDCHYTDIDEPKCAKDWETAIVVNRKP